MEGGLDGAHIPGIVECLNRQLHVDFPDLVGVTRFDRQQHATSFARDLEEAGALRPQISEHAVGAAQIEPIRACEPSAAMLRGQLRHQRAAGRQRGPHLRDQKFADAEALRNPSRVEAGRSAAAHEHRL
ncbi:hypothetical protein D9M69_665470 [compost metagenome]